MCPNDRGLQCFDLQEFSHQRGGRMYKTVGLNAEGLWVWIPGRFICSLKTIAIDAKEKYPFFSIFVQKNP